DGSDRSPPGELVGAEPVVVAPQPGLGAQQMAGRGEARPAPGRPVGALEGVGVAHRTWDGPDAGTPLPGAPLSGALPSPCPSVAAPGGSSRASCWPASATSERISSTVPSSTTLVAE